MQNTKTIFSRYGNTVVPFLLAIAYLTYVHWSMGLRTEHVLVIAIALAAYYLHPISRKLLILILPYAIFGMAYDTMRLIPNYTVSPIHVAELYNAEKALFGINTANGILTPNEWWRLHPYTLLDIIAGLFYINWVTGSLVYSFWQWWRGNTLESVHYTYAFLLVSLLGMAGYYLYPAAPPWYVAQYGFEVLHNTGGSPAGLIRFDQITGLSIFQNMYSRNPNVFGAMPSIHSAYPLLFTLYAYKHLSPAWRVFAIIYPVAIWFSAVYTDHHYIFDVLGGIGVTLLSYVIMEYLKKKFARQWQKIADAVRIQNRRQNN